MTLADTPWRGDLNKYPASFPSFPASLPRVFASPRELSFFSRKKSDAAATYTTVMPRPTYHASDRRTGQRTEIDWPTVLAQNDRWLRTVAAWRLRDRHAVDEVMQEVALAAVRQAAPLHDPSKVAPWLYRLTVRHVLLYRRQRGRAQRLLAHYEARGDWGRADRPRRPAQLVAGGRTAAVGAGSLGAAAAAGCGDSVAEVHGGLDLPADCRALGSRPQCGRIALHRARARLRSELAVLRLAEVEP